MNFKVRTVSVVIGSNVHDDLFTFSLNISHNNENGGISFKGVNMEGVIAHIADINTDDTEKLKKQREKLVSTLGPELGRIFDNMIKIYNGKIR